MIDIKDTGKFLAPILLDPEKYNGKKFAAATAYYTPAELVDGWKKITGKEVHYVKTKFEVPEGPLAPETVKLLDDTMNGGLMEDYGLFGPTGRSDLEWTLKQMDDVPTTWEEFVKANEPWF